MSRIDNLQAGRGARATTVIVPAVLLILGTSGVVAKPTLGLDAARRQRVQAEQREHEFGLERERALEFERMGGIRRIEEARAAVVATVPARLSALDLQNIVVLVARSTHIDLQTIEIGNPLETTFATTLDRVVANEASLRGGGTLSDIVAFVEGVQGLGLAVSVVESKFSRMTASDPRFEFQITLSFHHRDALLPAVDEELAGEN
ncbi:MAG: hypothetical protein SGI72_00250 [Planctomycetota bacterium]|nr:hypothetical protein [Planctomycetota bacterium]